MGKLKVTKNAGTLLQRIVDEMVKEFDEGAGEVRYSINDPEEDSFEIMITIERNDNPCVSTVHELKGPMTYDLIYEDSDNG
tara:strand:- start:4618 stop:4860 length:243 start_codon:yes stop_codon:yes gene_type:complete